MFDGASSLEKDLSSWNVSAALNMNGMFDGASSLSDCNKALIHASFDAQTSAWPSYYNSWGSLACLPSPPPASPPSPLPSASPFPPPPSASPSPPPPSASPSPAAAAAAAHGPSFQLLSTAGVCRTDDQNK